MSAAQFARKLGVSQADVDSWVLGIHPSPIYESGLDRLKLTAPSYLAEKARFAGRIRESEEQRSKSQVKTALLPNAKGSVATSGLGVFISEPWKK